MNKFFCVCSVAVAAFFGADAAVDQAKINAVMKGELKEAKASWWGFDANDSTKALQAAINSKVPRLIIDKQATPWISEPLFGVSNQTLVFEEGAELQAKRGSFKGRNDCLLKFDNVENVGIIGLGNGGIIRMHKKDYTDRKNYIFSEWRYCVFFTNLKNGKIENMQIYSSGGDGIDLNNVDGVVIKNVICDDHYRQGMSIIYGKNILVENCQFTNTSGTSPASGIDLEPSNSHQCALSNIVFKNCLFANNDRWGVLLAPSRFNSDFGGEIDIKFENCVIKNNKEGEFYCFTRTIYQDDEPVSGKIEVVNCVIQNDKKYNYLRPAMEFGIDLHHEMKIVLKDLTIKRGGNKEAALRFGFHYPREADSKPQSTVELDNVKFTDVSGKDMLKVIDYSFSGETEYFSGNITDRNGKTTELDEKFLKRVVTKKAPDFTYDYSDRAVKVAAPADGKMESYPEFPQNQHANFWFYAKAGQQAEFELKYTKIRRSQNSAVELIDPNGKTTRLGVIKPGETKIFKFTAGAAGMYKVNMAALDLHVALTASNVPAGIMLREPSHRVKSNTGTLYFNVPAGSPEFSIRVWGLVFSRYYNGVQVSISNPAGKVVFSSKSAADGISYTAPEAEAKKGGIWKITLGQPTQKQHRLGEYNIRMMGISPYIGLRMDRTPELGVAGSASNNKSHQVQFDDF